MIYLTYCILLAFIFNVINLSAGNVVMTTLGPVRGKLVCDPTTNATYYSYEGIPYAEPPVGSLRFQPPVRKQPWRGVFDARRPGRVCPQAETFYSRDQMAEDCLNLNIYVPAGGPRREGLLPVYVAIHDGGFDSQAGNAKPIYGPQLLVQQDIVIVKMNYRLGALGFLSLRNKDISGNAGAKDVLMALGMVQENIIRFGGDPTRVTLEGVGAGVAIAQLLMLTPQSLGLFNKAILLSGTILSPKYMQFNPKENAKLLALELGLDASNDDCLAEQLKKVDTFNIVKAQEAINRKDPRRGFRNNGIFKPTVEVNNPGAILTRRPLDLLREGATRDIPMLFGFNDKEGLEVIPLLQKEPELLDRLNKNFELLIPEDIDCKPGSIKCRNLAKRIREFYFSGGKITWDNIQNYINLVSDVHYVYSADLYVRLFIAKQTSKLYYYVLGSDTELNWFKDLKNLKYSGTAHNDEVGYIFLTEITKPKFQNLSANAKILLDNILNLSTTFVYNGAPPSSWPPTNATGFHLAINTPAVAQVDGRPYPDRIAFWTSVYNDCARVDDSLRMSL